MNTKSIHRKKHEIEHSQMLSESNTELAWGWDSPAGKIRAIRRAQLIAKQATLGYGLNVLEIGCGTGLFTEMFSQYGSSITALDVSADVLAHARLRGLSPKQVQFINESIEEYLLLKNINLLNEASSSEFGICFLIVGKYFLFIAL